MFEGKKIKYDLISDIVLEQTMLREGQIISNILRPLISENQVLKDGNPRSFKDNNYQFRRSDDWKIEN